MGESSGEKKVVMVAIDDVACCLYALEWALENLHDTITNSKLLICTVQPIPDFVNMAITDQEFIPFFENLREEYAHFLLDTAKKMCANHGITPETVTEVGNPSDKICEAVEKFKVALLVLGNRCHEPLERACLGSVSRDCVNKANCPVLVVKK